jgi:hypothetical protein
LRSSPKAKPVREPSEPITRWHGTKRQIGFGRAGAADGARSAGIADLQRDLTVGPGFPVGYPRQNRPSAQLEWRAAGGQLDGETAALAGEILLDLAPDVGRPVEYLHDFIRFEALAEFRDVAEGGGNHVAGGV